MISFCTYKTKEQKKILKLLSEFVTCIKYIGNEQKTHISMPFIIVFQIIKELEKNVMKYGQKKPFKTTNTVKKIIKRPRI